jgi:multidrug resistance efflux pump
MNAEILDSASSPPAGEVNYRTPMPSSSPPVRRWRMSIAFSLGVLVLLASFGIVAISLHSRADHPSVPSISTSASADETRWYSLGYVDIEGGVTPLYPLQVGRVKSIEARENKRVKAGEPLLYLENTVPLLKVRQAEHDLEGARKQQAVAQAGVEEANRQIEAQKIAILAARKKVDMARILLDKQKRFERQGIEGDKETVQAAQIAVEQAETAVRGEEAKLAVMKAAKRKAEELAAAAEALVEGKQAQLEEARRAVDECIVCAPVDGRPLRILVTVGETLGANPRQPAIQFAADRPLLVRAEVEQEFAGRVRLDQKVIVEDNITGEKLADGKVARLALWYAPRRTFSAEIVPLNGDNRTLECIINLDDPSSAKSAKVRIGQRVRVRFPPN